MCPVSAGSPRNTTSTSIQRQLNHYAIPLSQVIAAIQNSNTNAGGNYLNVGEQAFDVRGIGLIHSLGDIRHIVLATNKSTPIRVSNVADVSVGWSPRLGIVGMNNRDEVVEGIVLMRKHGNTLKTLKGVEEKVHELNTNGLMPRGYKVVPYYDRTGLVYTTLHTVLENLLLGMVLVFLVLIFFLGNLRTAIIAAINIPLAMLGAFILLRLTDTPANLLSLGAVDFGIIIDSTIIVVENIFRHLTTEEQAGDTLSSISRAAQEVGGPMFYSTTIFLIAFLPLFTMQGVEGAIFSPMSHTYAYALIVAIVLAVMLSPVLCSYLLHKGMKETHNFIWEAFYRLLPQPVCADYPLAKDYPVRDYGDRNRGPFDVPPPGRRIPAQTRRRQYLGARDNALDYLPAAGGQAGQPDASGVSFVSRGE